MKQKKAKWPGETYQKAKKIAFELEFGLSLLQRSRSDPTTLLPSGPWYHRLARLLHYTSGVSHLQVADLREKDWIWLVRLYRHYIRRLIHCYPVWKLRSALALAASAFLQLDDPIPLDRFLKTSLTNHSLASALAQVSFDDPEQIGRFVVFLAIARDFLKFLIDEVEGQEGGTDGE